MWPHYIRGNPRTMHNRNLRPEAREKYGKSFTHIISLLLAAVLFGYNILYTLQLLHMAVFVWLQSFPLQLVFGHGRLDCFYSIAEVDAPRIVFRAESTDQFWRQTRKIRLIESNAKCRYLKRWPVKVLFGRCYIYPRPSTLLLYDPILNHSHCLRVCIVLYIILIHTGKGGRGEGCISSL
jgi:hypothetical protein